MGLMNRLFGTYSQRELKNIEPITQKVLELDEQMTALTDSQLRAKTDEFRERLATGQTVDDILVEAFAVCREAAFRVLNMKHFPSQITGGVVLHQGRIAEMKTGEGKTLVATLPSYLNGLTGDGVHVVTVNDYLARRDSEWMGKVHRFLGLSVGLIVSGMQQDEKKAAYECDVIYGTNNEFGFDYLRDNMVIFKEKRAQRQHAFAIVDEVDSILIDEARTPLIISGQGDKSTDLYEKADRFARVLRITKVAELNDKEDNDAVYEGDVLVDEKAKTATLTPDGVKRAEGFFGVENLTDPENMTIAHHINQAIRAYGIMQRDVDYVVKDNQVLIVDEFTGRLMIGRRYNQGLHQAIEAKEKVKVARESKTLATVTFQNYFRMYKKLSGMTGTALTEEGEFQEIYGLDVIEIPTNKPMARKDLPDVIYKTEQGKFTAVCNDIAEYHRNGQPVLVGTISIEKSEQLSSMLKKRGIPHQVLNAKQHEKEALIVAQAGHMGAVTIATNMAGRGTDIMLGGNADYLAKFDMEKAGFTPEIIADATGYFETDNQDILDARAEYKRLYEMHASTTKAASESVKNAGGLVIIGTERHESRRIDNQLRGRAGRQGDPGQSRFYLSLEDDLMRLFGGERIYNMMDRMNLDENTPIENKMLTGSIENAQKKIEGRNFHTRKNVLQFDDVMNKQRETIYDQRAKVLNGDDMSESIKTMLRDTITDAVSTYISDTEVHDDWNLTGLRDHYMGYLTSTEDFRYTTQEIADTTREEIIETIVNRAMDMYDKKEEVIGSNVMRELERVALLKTVDIKWMDHIDAMDELRRGIGLRSYGQQDPVVAYRYEGFDMFEAMINSIKEDASKLVLTAKISKEAPKREKVAEETGTSGDGSEGKKPVVKGAKIGRNSPCPCGSGKKYKHCCGK